MNTNTGEIYEGEKKSADHISLPKDLAERLKEVPADERVNYLTNKMFTAFYETLGVDYPNGTKLDMRKAFRAGWSAREQEIAK